MRTIKFRGKRVNGGEWVKSMTISYGTIKRKAYEMFFEILPNKWVGVVPETVGQFTGMLDKNGKEIYEGDIIQSKMPISGELFNLEVAFKNGSFGTIGDITGELLPLIECDLTEYIVIGNIHDNPELLEGGDK